MLPGQGVGVSGSGSSWTPNQITSGTPLALYEVQASLVTVASGNVSNVVNRVAGGANPAVQASAGARPAFEAGGWGTGGKDSALFDGASSVLTAHGLASYLQGTDIPFSVLFLGQILTRGSAGNIRSVWGVGNVSTDTPLHDLRLPASTTDVLAVGRRDSGAVAKIPAAATALTGNRTLWSYVFTGTLSKLRVNGTLDAGGLDGINASADTNVGALTTLDACSIGALSRSGISGHTHMRMGAMFFCLGALSDSDLVLAENYLERGHAL